MADAAQRGPSSADRGVTPASIPDRDPVDVVHNGSLDGPVTNRADLTATEQRLLADLFAIVEEHEDQGCPAH